MRTNALTAASALSDQDLIARLDALARGEREATAELITHLAVLDARPSLYAAKGYRSLFAYCVEALHLSEDAACSRIEAARACRRFPEILDLLTAGSLTLTSVRLLARHLTLENHEAVLARACGRSRGQIEALVAELAPRPDVPTSVRRVPALPTLPTESSGKQRQIEVGAGSAGIDDKDRGAGQVGVHQDEGKQQPLPPARRSLVQATAPQRYRVQFTIGQDTHDKLRRLQTLLRREIPDGDAGAIFDRAVSLLLEQVERTKLGATKRPRTLRPVIRPGTDNDVDIRTPPRPSRHIAAHVKRAVRERDGDRCAFVSADGHRCSATEFLEFHHRHPWARRGPATVENISLRCRLHNQYEAEVAFAPRVVTSSPGREAAPPAGP